MFFLFGVGLFGLSFFVEFRGWAGWFPLVLLGISLGGFVYGARLKKDIPPDFLSGLNGFSGTIEGTFIEDFRFLRQGGVAMTLEDYRLEVASQTIWVPGKIRVHVKSLDFLPEPGQRYIGTGTLQIVKGRKKPGFICHRISFGEVRYRLVPFLGAIQKWVKEGSFRLLSFRHHSFIVGFLLGDTSLLDKKDRELFKETGVSHLLAVSGQHVMILGFVLIAILSWLGVPPLSRCLLAIVFLAIYGLITSGQPSVWRAIFMYITGVFILFFEADPGPIRPVALAAFLLLLYRPDWIGHLGFQLSFLAVLGILIGCRPVELFLQSFGLPLIVSRYLAVSFSANLATIPLIVYSFGYLPLVAFLVNPLVIWAFSIILYLGLMVSVLGNLWFDAGVYVAAALSLILDGFLYVVEKCGKIPFASVQIGQIPGILVAAMYGGMLLLIRHFEVSIGSGSSIAPLPSKSVPMAGRKVGEVKKREALQSSVPFSASVRESRRKNPIATVDELLGKLRMRSLKSRGNLEWISFPVEKLSLESQNLFHRLDDLSREVLRNEPDRIIQAQVFSLAILGIEIFSRFPSVLSPPPRPEEIAPKMKVRNRYLAMALMTKVFFDSDLPARAQEPDLVALIVRAEKLHLEGHALLEKLLNSRNLGEIAAHFSFRQALQVWCRDLINWQKTVKTKC